MPKHFRERRVRVDELESDPSRIYEPFVDAYMAYLRDPATPRRRKVAARDIHIPPQFAAPSEHVAILRPGFEELRRTNEEMMREIAVLEGTVGSLWTYDDTAMVQLYHELAPEAQVQCVIIGRDPAKPRAA